MKKYYSYITNLLVALILLVLTVFYVPKFGVVSDELPQLEGWVKENENSIKTVLPESFREDMTICFWSNHQGINVWLDGELIYSEDDREESFSDVNNSQWNRVHVPADSNKKELIIESATGEPPIVKEYVYGSEQQLNRWLHQHYGIIQLMDMGIIGIGLFFMLVALTNGKRTTGHYMPLHFGLSLVLVGIFLRTSLRGIPIHWLSVYSQEMLSYLSFYLMTIPMLAYVRRKIGEKELLSKICTGVLIAQMTIVLVIFCLHGTGICDISSFIWLGLLFWIILIIFSLIGTVLACIKRRNTLTLLALISSLIMILMLPLEICRYYYWSEYIREYGTISRYCFFSLSIIEIYIYSLTIQDLETRQDIAEQENKKLRLQLLSSQIRPHFILNTLGAIRSMIPENQQKASDLLYDFSQYLRSNIEEKDYMKSIPFQEEMAYIETYLRLEKARFRERLQVEYQIDEKEFRVLPLTIQPFVENAVKHGLFPLKEGGKLKIISFEQDENIIIEIRDNGVGFDTEIIKDILENKKSVGLRSAIYRIESEMKGVCTIKSRQEGVQGTYVCIRLPKYERGRV